MEPYCSNTNIYSYLETSGAQSSNPYLNVLNIDNNFNDLFAFSEKNVFFHKNFVICLLSEIAKTRQMSDVQNMEKKNKKDGETFIFFHFC